MLTNIVQPFLMALTLLTRLPVSRWVMPEWSPKHYRQSVYYYPLVGVLLALVLISFCAVLPVSLAANVTAILVLIVWVGLTGALHLDGLADCADAYFAAHKDGERAVLVFKDPASGPMGVTAVVLVLLLKFALLASLQGDLAVVLIVALSSARCSAMLMMNSMLYAREDEDIGIVKGLSSPRLTRRSYAVALLCVALMFALLTPLLAALTALALLALLLFWRRLWQRLIGGFTGDCLGALIELSEVMVLLVFVVTA